MSELGRIRWHCRRGLLELDLVLEKFNQKHLSSLDPQQLEHFKELLALADNDLLDLVMGRIAAPEPRHEEVLKLLRAA
jgi:antitoxin CptB